MSYGPPGPPPPGGFAPPPGYPSGGQPAAQPPKNYLWMNILGIFGCMGILGIIGLVFSLQVNSKWSAGDYAGAESAAGTARILGLISFTLTVITWVGMILYFIFVILMVGAATTTTYSY
ncbi:CD225/dispanin family protein [Thermobifida cellulosilytica]|uniref:Interferon-induced transmembrane protein n=1 Tax=Thermobifida cellulosilytica TB100 TaxID=665004 RepID=A0A147KMJ2_THECS|nr:CD225/dispanin family protein [Thermobifida cellulosilytica]KUP98524.1 Interferon-induced transmembrane protein [Thermobifida cellulosilytica TB100]